jgi:thiol-disulfide isomerase/thioredoxin
MRLIALIASIVAALQAVYGLVYGSIICPNSGCKIVETLTTIRPLYLNLLGFFFFQTVFWMLHLFKDRSKSRLDLLGTLLVGALVFDSALLAYQVFAVRTFCGYCLLIFGFVLALNFLYGKRQMVAGVSVLAALLLSFSMVTFVPAGVLSQTEPLKSAAYGVRSCSTPSKEIYLIFASNCPYCEKVLETLSNCNSCDLYLNPIDKVASIKNIEVAPNPKFSPTVNRLVLSVLGIDTVPVLVVKSAEGFRLIKGEGQIINYVRHACFTEADVWYYEKSIQAADEGITVLTDQDGECSVAIDCNPP